MRKILVCQHVPYEILGTLDPLFRDHGFRVRYVNFGRFPDAKPTIARYQGLVVLGGPMNVGDVARYPHLDHECRLIEDALRREIPVLGICLGAQLIARTLGAAVTANAVREIGWYRVERTQCAESDLVFSHFRDVERIFQWHGDTFALPAGATHLASSLGCSQQAFRYGDKVYGFQFHLEVDEELIARWLTVPLYLQHLRELHGDEGPERVRRETPLYIARSKALSNDAFGSFIDLFGMEKKRRQLRTR